MKRDSKFRREEKKKEDRKRLLSAVIIPLVIIILIIIIVVVDRDERAGETVGAEPMAVKETLLEPGMEAEADGSETAPLVSDDAEEGETEVPEAQGEEQNPEQPGPPENILRKDEDPELVSLMKTYFEARATGDAETMNRLYGTQGLSVTELEAEKTRMRSNSKYLRGFENIVTYVADGMTDDSWLVYTTCHIRFHSVDTAAPMIMWCYVTKNAEGEYLILDQQSLSPEILQFVDVVSRSEEVRRLASDVNGRLKEALLSDENLNEVYGVLREGSPVYQKEEETEAVQILDGEGESEPEPETSAAEESGETVPMEEGTETEAVSDAQ